MGRMASIEIGQRWGKMGLCIAICASLGACEMTGTGNSTSFNPENPHRRAVTIPAGAASISQQYRYFDNDDEEAMKRLGNHLGIDIKAPIGTPVIAAADGVVIASFFEPVYGNQVLIDHGPGPDGKPLRTAYFHLDTRDAKQGDRLKRGEAMGTLGLTGTAAVLQPHLHFEVQQPRSDGPSIPQDPHLFWVNGVGIVTCFEPGKRLAKTVTRLTYPVPCI